MTWTQRQHAMLAEMGTPLWFGPRPEGTAAEAATTPAAPVASQVVAVPRPPVMPPPLLQPTGARGAVRPEGVSRMMWPELRDAVTQCTACGLCKSRTQPVFGVGHPNAHWMIIGEAPGEQEDRQGEPFVGKSGQLLDNMLRAIGLSRGPIPAAPHPDGTTQEAVNDPERQVFIANTLKCRPPGNRNPEPEELAQCEPYLLRQIELVQPKIIVAMGRFAIQSLLRTSEPIGKLRGGVHQFQGVPLIVTYHPAYLLRNLQEKSKAWDDLCLARITRMGV